MPTLQKAIICDIDGTLAHGIEVTRKPYEWMKVGTDTLDDNVAFMLRLIKENTHVRVILMSGRDSVCRQETIKWLVKHKVPYDDLWMRAADDNRDDRIVKQELYEKFVKGRYDVMFALDDRNRVVDTWRGLGLVCWQVAPGDF